MADGRQMQRVARLPVGSFDRRKKSLCRVHMDYAAGAGRK